MYLTDLADALRAGGVGVWESPGWKSRGHGGMSGVRGIIIHHTAGGGSNDWKIVQNGRAGLAGPLAQMTFERDGGCRVLAAGQAWHAGTGSYPGIGINNGNAWMIGIEGVSRGLGNDWTSAQREWYPRVAAALCRHYRIPVSMVIGHKEWTSRKIDPGDWNMHDFRADVQRALNGSSPGPSIPPIPEKKKVKPVIIERVLNHGENYLRIPCMVGAASGLYGRAWVSITGEGGGDMQVAFQKNAPVDGPPPGAGPMWGPTVFRNASRVYKEIPSGTEYLEVWVKLAGRTGAVAIEFDPK